jgi:hypothetical protein
MHQKESAMLRSPVAFFRCWCASDATLMVRPGPFISGCAVSLGSLERNYGGGFWWCEKPKESSSVWLTMRPGAALRILTVGKYDSYMRL